MSEPFIAQIMIFGGNFAPRGWAFCNGQLLSIVSNTALFSLVGTTYGGDGRTTFGLPDLRGRAPIHVGTGPGLTRRNWGERGGVEKVTLTVNQIPAHNHSGTARCFDGAGNSNEATGNTWSKDLGVSSATYNSSAPNANMAADTITTQNTGGNQSHENMPPFLALHYIIALVGIFPSRN